MKQKIEALVFAVLLLIGSRTLPKSELKDIAIVTALGFDYDARQYTVTACIYDSKQSVPQEEKRYYALTAKGDTPLKALSALQQNSAKQLFHKHSGIILLGDGMNTAEISKLIESVAAFEQISLGSCVLKCDGDAGTFLKGEDDILDAAEFEAFFSSAVSGVDYRVPLLSLLQQNAAASGAIPVAQRDGAHILHSGWYLFGEGGNEVIADRELCSAVAVLYGKAIRLDSNAVADSTEIIRSTVLYADDTLCCYVRLQSDNSGFAEQMKEAVKTAYIAAKKTGADAALQLQEKSICGYGKKGAYTAQKDVLIPLGSIETGI
ncbi:MAG: hypothetical protein IJP01_05060 [Oscillospiraceae bacterium]|nr:hypothetical protein [Oscillospiraceae bacterium]